MVKLISKVMLVYHMGGGGRNKRTPGLAGRIQKIMRMRSRGARGW